MIAGVRVHLAGSAAADVEASLLTGAHLLVSTLAAELISHGAGLVVQVGAEPRSEGGQACIFDWTCLEVVASAPDPAPGWPHVRPERFVAAATQRGLDKVPTERAGVWQRCRRRSDFQLDVAPAGWRMASIIRQRQVLRGDVLIVIGGGGGVEHLADLYREEGKPVIPIWSELGALNADGSGGGRILHERALAGPELFFRLGDGAGNAAGRLTALRLTRDADAVQLAQQVVGIIADLRPPPAFYVRLLATDHAEYSRVERFFREIVDPVVVQRGFTPRQMGRDRPQHAFMNVEIFESLHHAGLVVVDLTGVRPSCMMELGYALGRRRRVVISAANGTQLPFDSDKLPTYLWKSEGTVDERADSFNRWVDQHIDLPPLVG